MTGIQDSSVLLFCKRQSERLEATRTRVVCDGERRGALVDEGSGSGGLGPVEKHERQSGARGVRFAREPQRALSRHQHALLRRAQRHAHRVAA